MEPHPELLDYLARKFMDEGWSTKGMIRFLVLSQAFQQSGAASVAGMERDPQNALLHHVSVRRLSAEEIRDTLLSVAGELHPRTEGPSVQPYRKQPKDYRRLFSGPLLGEDGIVGPLRFPATADRVIFLFMPGGVSHMERFDPKPKLAELDGKQAVLNSYVAGPKRKWLRCLWEFQQYGECGAPVSSLFHNMARHVDDFAIVRWMHSPFPLHARGNVFLHTGRLVGGCPSLGSWTVYGLGSENQNLPGFILLRDAYAPPGGIENFSDGFLPATHQATHIRDQGVPIDNIEPADEAENEAKRDYGLQCLRARRLVEKGVRFVDVTCPNLFGMSGTWDQHSELREGHETNALVTDQAIAGLVTDLKSRGMLERTLVVWAGEFGRTPDTGNGGVDHERLTYRFGGREHRLIDLHGSVVHEILA